MPISPRIVSTLACLAIACTMVRGEDLEVLCNPENFDVNPFYPFTVAFLDQVVDCTWKSEDSSCSINETYKEGSLWGHGGCSQNLKGPTDCEYCTGTAKEELYKRCDTRVKGAHIRLAGCSLRYETYGFIADPPF
ncbi:hypothetical protein MLD38_002450 [Melastoma candidum]|uniref:Uncharacterized protein n=1 Tax=Melastoma candidum TaxID=119954 RepID=A0ACB9S349_9MYRT|nr:hypothetical protein MLD38_002450 [Melastoma candidum]